MDRESGKRNKHQDGKTKLKCRRNWWFCVTPKCVGGHIERVLEREREREKGFVSLWEREKGCVREDMCHLREGVRKGYVSLWERERERERERICVISERCSKRISVALCVCVCGCVCVREREAICVCEKRRLGRQRQGVCVCLFLQRFCPGKVKGFIKRFFNSATTRQKSFQHFSLFLEMFAYNKMFLKQRCL